MNSTMNAKVTPEMIEAGTEVLFDFLPDALPVPGDDAQLVRIIFEAMDLARSKADDKL